jgi:nucleotide sugar dehydrogenase
MNIGIIGTGYVGLVQGVTLAEFGMNVICMDVQEDKIEMLKQGILPIYEPGLKEMLDKNVNANRLSFTTDIKETTEKSDVIFIAVGTPPNDDGSADLRYVIQATKHIAEYINGYKVIVNKSTVPVGTGMLVEKTMKQVLESRNVEVDIDIVSNPEFLREGKAVKDCLTPDRIVIGTKSVKAKEIMRSVYDVLYINQTPMVFTSIETAEMIKYASNAFLAVKISFINEIALLAEKVGANVQEIARAMGMDGRISPKFLHAGPGYGGSCFPKDTKAIVDIGRKHGEEMMVVEAAIRANEKQKRKMVDKIICHMGDNGSLKGKTIGILGLSFKPETDDVREAPSLDIIEGLVNAGAFIHAYCPQGIKEAKWRLEHLSEHIIYAKDEYEASCDVDAIAIVTEWHQFRGMDLDKIRRSMKGNIIFDLRNIYSKRGHILENFTYVGVGT